MRDWVICLRRLVNGPDRPGKGRGGPDDNRLSGGNVGGHHQPVILGNAGLQKRLVLFKLPAEGFAVKP
jgi:hypothetical protein